MIKLPLSVRQRITQITHRLVNILSRNRVSAFAEGTPSVFSICSPYQLLCAVEAINRFKIQKFKMIICFYEGNPRNKQLITMLNHFKIKYTAVKPILTRSGYHHTITPNFSKYKRGFIGDYRSDVLLYHCIQHISNNSKIVFLDDGAASIYLLSGKYTIDQHNKQNQICSLRNIEIGNHFFTQYDSISNKNISVCVNDMDYLKRLVVPKTNIGGIYFVGTNPPSYINYYTHITLDDFKDKQEKIFSQLRQEFPNDTIYYYSHPSDNTDFIQTLCEKYNIIHQTSEMAIEFSVLASNTAPSRIYGFNSTALINIKTLIPETPVISFVLDSPKNSYLESYCEYIHKHGIKIALI